MKVCKQEFAWYQHGVISAPTNCLDCLAKTDSWRELQSKVASVYCCIVSGKAARYVLKANLQIKTAWKV